MRSAVQSHRAPVNYSDPLFEESAERATRKRQKKEETSKKERKMRQRRDKLLNAKSGLSLTSAVGLVVTAGLAIVDSSVSTKNAANSQALVEVKTEINPWADIDYSDFLASAPSHNLPVQKQGQSLQFKSGEDFLENAYTSFDLRDSYLRRQAMPLAPQADSLILITDEYETTTCSAWRSADQDKVYMSAGGQYDSNFYADWSFD